MPIGLQPQLSFNSIPYVNNWFIPKPNTTTSSPTTPGPIQVAMDALLSAIRSAVNTLPNGPIIPGNVSVVQGYYTQQEMRQTLTLNNAIISIFDAGIERSSNRFISSYNSTQAFWTQPAAPSIMISPATPTVLPLTPLQNLVNINSFYYTSLPYYYAWDSTTSSMTSSGVAIYTLSLLSGSFSPNPTDSLVISASTVNSQGQPLPLFGSQSASYTVQVGDTLSSTIAGLVNAVSKNPSLLSLISVAQNNNNTFSVSNASSTNEVFVNLSCGVQGVRRFENRRTDKVFKVEYWAPTHEIREFIADWVDTQLSTFMFALGLPTEDQNYLRIWYVKTLLDDSDQQRNLYKRTTDYRIQLPFDTTTPVYSVNAINASYTPPQ